MQSVMQSSHPPTKVTLITGTHSGIGLALLRHYTQKEHSVICINRRQDSALEAQFPHAHFQVGDITDPRWVRELLIGLEKRNLVPELFILNAGINQIDNLTEFSLETFQRVMRTNLDGVLTFVEASRKLGWRKRHFVAMSSTSNIVPNPAHAGYHVSKWALWRLFDLLQANDPENFYQSTILGPIQTNIMAGYAKPQGMQGKIFELLVVEPTAAATACARFFESGRSVLLFPWFSVQFYRFARLLTRLFPFLYRGTKVSPRVRVTSSTA